MVFVSVCTYISIIPMWVYLYMHIYTHTRPGSSSLRILLNFCGHSNYCRGTSDCTALLKCKRKEPGSNGHLADFIVGSLRRADCCKKAGHSAIKNYTPTCNLTEALNSQTLHMLPSTYNSAGGHQVLQLLRRSGTPSSPASGRGYGTAAPLLKPQQGSETLRKR